MYESTYKACVSLNEILYSIDHQGGFMFKFVMMVMLSITFLILSIITLILAPFSAYKKTKIQKQKELNAESSQ